MSIFYKIVFTAFWISQLWGVNGGCVTQRALQCVNEYSTYWPKCDPSQSKTANPGTGHEFGYYCTQEWANGLNEMLATPEINKCADTTAIQKFLAQVGYETAFYSTVYQPADGGAGLIHMIPGNWELNAKDMDEIWPGNNYAGKVNSMGKTFFQTAAFGWKSVAAWFKKTNRVIGGCGKDLFDASYDTQTRCILSRVVDRSEIYRVVGDCLQKFPGTGNNNGGESPVVPTTPKSPTTPSTGARDPNCDKCTGTETCFVSSWKDGTQCSAGSQTEAACKGLGGIYCGASNNTPTQNNTPARAAGCEKCTGTETCFVAAWKEGTQCSAGSQTEAGCKGLGGIYCGASNNTPVQNNTPARGSATTTVAAETGSKTTGAVEFSPSSTAMVSVFVATMIASFVF